MKNLELIDSSSRKIKHGDTVLVYTKSENKWTTEIAWNDNGILYSIWENNTKRVSTPIIDINKNHIIILVRENGIQNTDLFIQKKEKLQW